ncbi:uncharacterized protein LOC141507264 [Macrotis lagotis]|uniref:uncharacterized protein LOC141507264 n=1 Tax=Macrotis lagotis TaxID=92651 RepID=UPI003D699C6D
MWASRGPGSRKSQSEARGRREARGGCPRPLGVLEAEGPGTGLRACAVREGGALRLRGVARGGRACALSLWGPRETRKVARVLPLTGAAGRWVRCAGAEPRQPGPSGVGAAGKRMETQSSSQTVHRTLRIYMTSLKGIVKLVRLVLIIAALILFVIAQSPETYIVITALETIILVFFVLLYILRLDLVLKCLFWPLLDILNSVMTIVFLLILSVLALIPKTTVLVAIGGILGIVAVVFTIADAALIYRKLLFNPSGPYEKKHSHGRRRRSPSSHPSHHSNESQPTYGEN